MRSNGPLHQVFISGVQSFARTNDCKSNVFILFLECNPSYVRTIASQILFHFWSAIVRTYERLQVKFLFHFWCAIVRTYERLQVKCFYFISGVQSFVRTNDCKPNAFILFLECNRSYVLTIANEILFHFWSAIVRTYERLQAKCFYFISGVQSFVRTNDCKSNFYFYFWSAIVRTYERLQVKFSFLFLECNRSHVRTIASQIFLFHFWSAIVRTYERLQVKFLFLFQECNRSYVRTIANQIFLFHFWSAIVRTYERLQVKCFYLFQECNRSHVR